MDSSIASEINKIRGRQWSPEYKMLNPTQYQSGSKKCEEDASQGHIYFPTTGPSPAIDVENYVPQSSHEKLFASLS